jgi:hypothetical protein
VLKKEDLLKGLRFDGTNELPDQEIRRIRRRVEEKIRRWEPELILGLARSLGIYRPPHQPKQKGERKDDHHDRCSEKNRE